jgi:hypothetical protein
VVAVAVHDMVAVVAAVVLSKLTASQYLLQVLLILQLAQEDLHRLVIPVHPEDLLTLNHQREV